MTRKGLGEGECSDAVVGVRGYVDRPEDESGQEYAVDEADEDQLAMELVGR